MAVDVWAAEWQAAEHTGADMVQEEQAQGQLVAILATAVLLRARTAQLVVSAAGVAVRVHWLTWALAREITSRRRLTSMSAVEAISLDLVGTSPA